MNSLEVLAAVVLVVGLYLGAAGLAALRWFVTSVVDSVVALPSLAAALAGIGVVS